MAADFPRKPKGQVKLQISSEADGRLNYYLPTREQPATHPGVEAPPPRKLPEGVIDAPLVRLFNFLRTSIHSLFKLQLSIKNSYLLEMMSLSYQLEILCFQVSKRLIVAHNS